MRNAARKRKCLLESTAPNNKRALFHNKQIEPSQSQASQHYEGCGVQGHCDSSDGDNHNQVVDFEVEGILAKSASGLHMPCTRSLCYCRQRNTHTSEKLTSAKFDGLAKELRSTISVHGFLCTTSDFVRLRDLVARAHTLHTSFNTFEAKFLRLLPTAMIAFCGAGCCGCVGGAC